MRERKGDVWGRRCRVGLVPDIYLYFVSVFQYNLLSCRLVIKFFPTCKQRRAPQLPGPNHFWSLRYTQHSAFWSPLKIIVESIHFISFISSYQFCNGTGFVIEGTVIETRVHSMFVTATAVTSRQEDNLPTRLKTVLSQRFTNEELTGSLYLR